MRVSLFFCLFIAFNINADAAPYCEPPPHAAGCLSGGLATSFDHRTNLWGYVNAKGVSVIAPRYIDARAFSENLAAVSIKTPTGIKSGFINPQGELVIKAVYDKVGDFSEGLAAVVADGKLGYIDSTGKSVIAPHYQVGDMMELHAFSHHLAAVRQNGQWGYINNKGSIVIGFGYQAAGRFGGGLAKVIKEGKLGFIDTHGNFTIKPQYDSEPATALLYSFDTAGVATVRYEGKVGVIDTHGKIIVPFGKYPYIGDYHQSLAVFGNGEKYGYISHTGEIMLPAEYDMAYDFDGYGVVEDWVFEEKFRVDKKIITPTTLKSRNP